MRVRKALRKSTKSEVLIDMSLWSNVTTLPWTSVAATTAMHLKLIFALSIFKAASPAFAQYLALIWLLVKHASSTKTMFARYSMSLITWGSILRLVLFMAVSCVAVNCWLKRITRCFTWLSLYTLLSFDMEQTRPGKRMENNRVRCKREKVIHDYNIASLQR